jgi:NADH dehydrogenase [ubiquinone] 1 alpha subcomplex assembly factor 7
MSLENLIKERIKKYGAMNIADYMNLCLTHPDYGYYMRRDPFGVSGDFTTAPEISQIFGELLGLWLAAQWQKQGKPECIFLEMGPGRGTLMADILRATKKIAGFHDALSIYLLEISPTLRQKQWATLAGKHDRIQWINSLNELPNQPLFFIANEFFDALPIHQYENGTERTILLDDKGELSFAPSPSPNPFSEICPDAKPIMKQLGQTIAKHGGAGLIIDYGYMNGSSADTLQALQNHKYYDILKTPGEADITAHVDFAALASYTNDAKIYGAIPQGKFLLNIGASQRLQTLCAAAPSETCATLMGGFERLIAPDQMGELFKVLAVMPPTALKPEGFDA